MMSKMQSPGDRIKTGITAIHKYLTFHYDIEKNDLKLSVIYRALFGICLLQVQYNKKSSSSKSLQTGDVFITRHSNLAQVHAVFHMVVNDTLRSGLFL